MFYFLFRYRYRKGVNETGAIEEGGPGIEVLWTVIPLIIVIYLAMQSLTLYTRQRTPPPDSLPVKVEGMGCGAGTSSTRTARSPRPISTSRWASRQAAAHRQGRDPRVPHPRCQDHGGRGSRTRVYRICDSQFGRTGRVPGVQPQFCGTAPHLHARDQLKVVTPEEFEQWLKQPG